MEKLTLEGEIKGVKTTTFVVEYKHPNMQMHARQVSGKRLSADTYDLLDEMIYVFRTGALGMHNSDVADQKGIQKVLKRSSDKK